MLKKGLNDQQVRQSREKYGNNVIPDSEPTTFWAEFKETFSDPMIKILLFIAGLMVVMFFLGYAEIYEPIGTVVAVLIVAFVTAKTGVASDTKYRELKNSTKKHVCKVYRNSMVTVIEVDDVVVGDKVLLQSGDKIPADGILVEGDLRVDNSALNGEAEECKKFATDISTEMADNITPAVYQFISLAKNLLNSEAPKIMTIPTMNKIIHIFLLAIMKTSFDFSEFKVYSSKTLKQTKHK